MSEDSSATLGSLPRTLPPTVGFASPRGLLFRFAGDTLARWFGHRTSRYEELRQLCATDIEHWRRQPLDEATYLAHLESLNRTRADLFVFDVRDGQISIRDKPAPTGVTRYLQKTRLPAYRMLFEQVARVLAPELKLSFGLLLEDLARGHPLVPLMSFQKSAEDNLLLTPEIDSLVLNFYDSPDLLDELEHDAKRDAAVFVGSTTGVDPKTGRSVVLRREDIDVAPMPRIRAAKRFQGMPRIDFRLPGVVQCDGPETEAYLRTMEFCQGQPVSWKKQYDYRFIISIDGNGATCSRLALSLKSRSVLLKYASPYVLFYTRALRPNVHFLPVATDEDVIAYAVAPEPSAAERRADYKLIQENANAFYRRFLSRTAQHRYTAVLLNELHGLICGEPVEPIRRRIDTLAVPLDIMAHVADVGDRWYWPALNAGSPGSGEHIEAFTIRVDQPDGSETDLTYQCIWQDGTLGPWLPSGTLCGLRGMGRPLAGFRLRVSGQFARRYGLRYRASFVGEGQSAWLGSGSWCTSGARAALESMEVELMPRGLRRAWRRLQAGESPARP